jgi:hypothetical protein
MITINVKTLNSDVFPLQVLPSFYFVPSMIDARMGNKKLERNEDEFWSMLELLACREVKTKLLCFNPFPLA